MWGITPNLLVLNNDPLEKEEGAFLDNKRVIFTTPNKSLLPYISEYIYSIPNNPANICDVETSQH